VSSDRRRLRAGQGTRGPVRHSSSEELRRLTGPPRLEDWLTPDELGGHDGSEDSFVRLSAVAMSRRSAARFEWSRTNGCVVKASGQPHPTPRCNHCRIHEER
jgi:hypothetical protein